MNKKGKYFRAVFSSMSADRVLDRLELDANGWFMYACLHSGTLTRPTNDMLQLILSTEVHPNKKIVRKTFWKDADLSTMFLCINHSYSFRRDSSPKQLLFETMDFGFETEEGGNYQQRYTTWKQAVHGHYKRREELIAVHGLPEFEITKNRRNTKFISYHFACQHTTNNQKYIKLGICPHYGTSLGHGFNHGAAIRKAFIESEIALRDYRADSSSEPLT